MAFSLSTAFGQPNSFDDAARNQAKKMSRMVFFMMKYTDWPENHTSGDFVIGVYGDEFLYKEISTNFNGTSTGSQSIKVIRYISVNDIDNCHLLFVAKSKSDYIDQINKKVDHHKTLLISNEPGLIEKGPTINFVPVNGRMKWEINLTKAKKYNFIIGEDLKKSAHKTI
jgi:hypothetical protein|tara:strand:- start:160 stop:666 length:507 start_codon:yes stop_codon:yes gene_type:complete